MSVVDSNVAILEAGVYTPTEDSYAQQTTIQHNLGVVPDFIIYFSDYIYADPSYSDQYMTNAYLSACNLDSLQTTTGFYYFGIASRQTYNQVSINFEQKNMTAFANTEMFKFPTYNSGQKLKAGVAYHWVIGKFK